MEILNKNQRSRAIWRMILLAAALLVINVLFLDAHLLEFYQKGLLKATLVQSNLKNQSERLGAEKVETDKIKAANTKLVEENLKLNRDIKDLKEEDKGKWKELYELCMKKKALCDCN